MIAPQQHPYKREQREGAHTLFHCHSHFLSHTHTREYDMKREPRERFEDARLGDWGDGNRSRNANNKNNSHSPKLKEAEPSSPHPPHPAPRAHRAKRALQTPWAQPGDADFRLSDFRLQNQEPLREPPRLWPFAAAAPGNQSRGLGKSHEESTPGKMHN